MVDGVVVHLEAWPPQAASAACYCICGRHGTGLNLGIGYASPDFPMARSGQSVGADVTLQVKERLAADVADLA